jgi:hypothetical protein
VSGEVERREVGGAWRFEFEFGELRS